ncbi:DUF808 domain-containing protein [Aquitalea magnusonii]|uniref:Inner membrane protein YedI n=1 Tax=Aquitalea magnusonii TaxID=332411 RepID=A0A318JIG2_9NEIS|nr:DUF808 domain-containing protein [Aquitalea magnusonii]PXX48760.1 hypothetical protein DFR38_106137 [Aquitalea magnusonii]
MAGASLLTLLDDIASVLDDVAVMTKVAARKTAGVLGDDLALNAQQVSGVRAERELPVVWAVARGSLRNKAILVPLALALSAFAPWAVMPLLMLGGVYLCLEGMEKLVHPLLHDKSDAAGQEAALAAELAAQAGDLQALERDRIKGAVRTDFVLSAEIIAITLGTVAAASLSAQLVVLVGVALIMTVGVYGFVALLVKLDDIGLYLLRQGGPLRSMLGRGLIRGMPWLMKALAVVGTVAMFMVGGGIISHGWPALHHAIEALLHPLSHLPAVAALARLLVPALLDVLVGMLAGSLALGLLLGWQRLRR